MKKSTKRIWSALLALLMLVTVLPVGVFTVTAGGTDGDFELNDTDTTYTIDGPLDWNIVAGLSADGETFAGKTIQLACDIDGAAAAEAGGTLTTPLFTTFAGTFTGLKNAQGTTNAEKYYGIKNVSVSTSASKKGVIANEVSGTAAIKELNLDTVALTSTSNSQGLLVGNVQASADLTVEHIHMTACSLTSSGGSVALFVGNVATANVTALNCSVSGTMSTQGSATAVLIGYYKPNGNTLTVTNFDVHDLTINTTNFGVGTVVGMMRNDTTGQTSGKITANLTNVDLTDVAVNQTNTAEAKYGVGGMFGAYHNIGSNSEINIADSNLHNVTVGGAFASNAGGVLGRGSALSVSLKIKNIEFSGTNTISGISNGDSADALDRGAGALAGSASCKGANGVEVDGMTVKGTLSVSHAHRAGMLFGLSDSGSSKVSVKNVTVEQGATVTVTAKAENNTKGYTSGSAAGVVVGEKRSANTLTVDTLVLAGDVTVTGANTGGSYAGGIAGYYYGSGALTVTNFTVGGKLALEANNSAGGVLGMTGSVKENGTSEKTATEKITVTNMTVVGALTAKAANQASAVNAQDGSSGATTVTGWTLAATGSVTLDAKQAGAIIGQTYSGGTLTVTDTTVAGTITAHNATKNGNLGGLVGYAYGGGKLVMDGVTVSGTIDIENLGTDPYLGGLLGYSRLAVAANGGTCVSIQNVTVSGTIKVTGDLANGGIVGELGSWTWGANQHVIENIAVVEDGAINLTSLKMNAPSGNGGIVGVYLAKLAGESLTVRNVDLKNLTISGNTGKSLAGQEQKNMNRELMGNAAVIGSFVPYADTDLTVSNIRVAGTTISHAGVGQNNMQYHKDGSIGGVIGYVTEYAGMYTIDHDGNADTAAQYVYDRYTGTIDIANCEVDAVLNSAITSDNQGVGGLIGSYGQRGTNSDKIPDMHATSVLNISDCVVKGSIKGSNNATAGVIGWIGFNGATVNIDSVVVAPSSLTSQTATYTYETNEAGDKVKDENENYIIAGTETKDNETGLILGRSLRSGLTMNVTNCYTTLKSGWHMLGDMGGQAGWLRAEIENEATGTTDVVYKLIGDTVVLNGIAYTASQKGWEGGALDAQNDVISSIKESQLSILVTHDETTGAVSVTPHLRGGFVQQSEVYTVTRENTISGYYTLRFVVLANNKNASRYQINVQATTESGDVYRFDNIACKSYDYLLAYNEGENGGLTEYSYEATELGGLKMIAVVIKGIPTGEAMSFEVTASYQTVSGVTVTDQTYTAQYDASGTLLNGNAVAAD